MTALTTSYTCWNFSQRWPSCHLQNSNLLPFPLLVQLHLHFSQGPLFSLWWNSNGTKIIFSFASTCTNGQGNFQCCPKTEEQYRCSLFNALCHSLEIFIFSFAIWTNHQIITKNTIVQWYPLMGKRFFSDSYFTIGILYFSSSDHLCIFQLVFQTFFYIFFNICFLL